jgi:ATP-dependent Clp protease adapter protein ClpS
MTSTTTNPVLADAPADVLTDAAVLQEDVLDHLWAVVVLNDDVTTFATVIEALVTLFGHTHDAAERLAWIVHRAGRAVVAVGSLGFAEDGVRGLHAYRIQADLEPA